MAKSYSIIVIPGPEKKVRRFQVRQRLLLSLVFLCLLFIGGFVFLCISYSRLSLDAAEFSRLRVENNRQRQDLHGLALRVEDMKQQLILLAETEAQIRRRAKFKSGAELPVAIGGLPAEDAEAVDTLQAQINQLQLELEHRRNSQEEVLSLLNDQLSLNRSTPRGWPTKGWLTSYFGMRKSPFTGRLVMHEGLDIAANVGTPVYATADGVVARVSYGAEYGKTVVVDHGYGYRSIFGHNSKILVKKGDRIKRGDKLALVGNTGRSTGPHLHYELRLNGVPIDPRKTL